MCQRRGEPVREAEMSVRLRHRRWDPPSPRREHHRTGDVTARAEDDVRPPPRKDRAARSRCAEREPNGAYERHARPPRKARDAERVELVAPLRNELRLDAIRRPGERHFDVAVAERLRHRERRRDVSDRPARRYQAPKLSLLLHRHARC